MRAGFAFLGIGLVADVAYHATHGLYPHSHGGGLDLPMAIHLLVGTGMVTTLAGLFAAGIRSTRKPRDHKEAYR